MLKNLSLIALQQQEVILFLWITVHLYESYKLKVSDTYRIMLQRMQKLHSWHGRELRADLFGMPSIHKKSDDLQGLIVAR